MARLRELPEHVMRVRRHLEEGVVVSRPGRSDVWSRLEWVGHDSIVIVSETIPFAAIANIRTAEGQMVYVNKALAALAR